MKKAPLLIAMPGNEQLAGAISAGLGGQLGQIEVRRFPDEETYLRFEDSPERRKLIVVCTLDRPDTKILPLLFTAATARELGAEEVGLIAPYLAYMRQDRRFKPGEAVTSRTFAHLLSDAFDWLITVDPHLHRYGSLSEIYATATRVVHAAPLISRWIKQNVTDPVIIGPDSESEQWVSATASQIGAPYTILEKTRLGDRDVQIRIRDAESLAGHTPVFVDDIISTGRTMIEAVRLVKARGSLAPVCVAVHGLFSDQADRTLTEMGARIVTCNTVPHDSNAVDVTEALAAEVRKFSETLGRRTGS